MGARFYAAGASTVKKAARAYFRLIEDSSHSRTR